MELIEKMQIDLFIAHKQQLEKELIHVLDSDKITDIEADYVIQQANRKIQLLSKAIEIILNKSERNSD